MAKKLEGFEKVVQTKIGTCTYHFALYEDGTEYKEGDKILVSGQYKGVTVIEKILSKEECEAIFAKNIISEVICKVNTSAYDERVRVREEKEKLKKEMDKLVKALEEDRKYEIFADKSPELAAMLERYKEL